ncbi:MAG TPA: alpha,alpha-trehalase TreF [Steroidobacteraceae bacterium]
MCSSVPSIRARVLPAIAALLLVWAGVVAQSRDAAPRPPSQLYGELFHRVQTGKLFADSKTFADAVARTAPAKIVRDYEKSRNGEGFSLDRFVAAHFDVPSVAGNDYQTTPRQEIRVHINQLWNALVRAPKGLPDGGSLLRLSTRYVVPGGRFRELYYWDSYFTMLGLQVSGREDLIDDMVENFAGLIDRFGHIPNGSRTYYLSRSQPPFFAAMVELQAEHDSRAMIRRLPQLEREYEFWMEGAASLTPGTAHRRVVRLDDGSLLNRYWDDLAIPRDESYLEDLETAKGSTRAAPDVYRDLRAAAESGWDFSSRWLADGKTLSTIHTTDFLPVDLNSLLYKLELTIARGCEEAKRPDCDTRMRANALARQTAMLRVMWSRELDAFTDYDWRNKVTSTRLTAATVFPLYVGLASSQQAQRVASTLRESLLTPHGLATTTETSGQQWDAPNGWAPLQWIAIEGLRKNGDPDLAAKIAEGWVAENARVYCKTGKLVEKYNVRDAGEGSGGEYPVQDGFGWTNGVLLKLLAVYPQLSARRYEFTGAACATTSIH